MIRDWKIKLFYYKKNKKRKTKQKDDIKIKKKNNISYFNMIQKKQKMKTQNKLQK